METNSPNVMIFQGYLGVIPAGRIMPIALFQSEEYAKVWRDEHYPNAEIRKYPASSLFLEVLRQC